MSSRGPSAESGRAKAAPSPIPTILIGIGLAWLTLEGRAPPFRPRPPGQPQPQRVPLRLGEPDPSSTARDKAAPAAAGVTGDQPGSGADSPTEIPARGWWQVVLRVKDQIAADNVSIIAAGCAFFAILALFPGITALVSIYGLVADPGQIEGQIEGLAGVVPPEALQLVRDQAHTVAAAGNTALGWSALLAILLALYSASSGVKSVFEALNIAYEEEESRGLVRLNITAFLFTLAAIVGIAVCIAVIVGVPAVLRYLPLGPLASLGVRVASWVILLAVVMLGLGLLYRFGPSRSPADWRWLSPGAIAATLLWLVASFAFSYYAAHFGSYNQTYGALAGVIILLFWLWISAFVVMLGAELNSELELQTERDSTTGRDRPMGGRGAYVADHTPQRRAADPATT